MPRESNDDYRDNFRENLKAVRIKMGYTQADLSLRANYDSTYVGKLERGVSDPSIETVKRLGEALDIDPLMLLSPNLAHLKLLDSIPPEELRLLPFNPLEIEIFDSLPYPMGILTVKGTPVYINDMFVESTGIERQDISDQRLWDLPFWTFRDGAQEQLTEAISSISADVDGLKFELSLDSGDDGPVELSFYPSPREGDDSGPGMWIFELRNGEPGDLTFPINVVEINKRLYEN